MSLRHWVWISTGLAVWAGLVLLWATSPTDCQPPDDQHRVVCRR